MVRRLPLPPGPGSGDPPPAPPGPGTVFDFELPDALSAQEPPERRGLARDGVRLLAVDRGTGALRHGRFRDLPDLLRPGDCLVLNASRTLPASLPARLYGPEARPRGEAPGSQGAPVEVRLARRLDGTTWSALLLDAFENPRGAGPGDVLRFGAGLAAEVLGPEANPRLVRVRFSRAGAAPVDSAASEFSGSALVETLSRLGQPVRYWYAARPWALDWYQTVFAREPGSMEMPSAGRAFTWELLLALRRRGVHSAFLVLHAGLSSYMDAEFDAAHPVAEEPYRISAGAAEAVNAAKDAGGRIVAVGTTAVRALESAADATGRIRAGEGLATLRITADHRLRVADGLITGFHEPRASHLDLLKAFLPEGRLREVYAEALRERYLWHEFGDINLIV
jgi:S-adenosylmethionine:tRNA ribosyltransferase-isomerase